MVESASSTLMDKRWGLAEVLVIFIFTSKAITENIDLDGKWSLITVLVYIDFCVLDTSKVHNNTFLAASQTIQDSNTSIILLYSILRKC